MQRSKEGMKRPKLSLDENKYIIKCGHEAVELLKE